MNFDEYCSSVIDCYPEYVTQKEMCAILGICKSTAYSIQKKGIIPFEYVSTSEGRRQRIKIADILLYQYQKMCFREIENEYVEGLRLYYQKQLQDYPQLLLVSDVMRFTGYAKTTINNWIQRNELKSLRYKNKRIQSFRRGKGSLITKDAFLDFLTGPYYRSISRKSDIHKAQAEQYEQLFDIFMSKRGVANVQL
jgi:predicted DNA-binding transcriptional regulator AlpA